MDCEAEAEHLRGFDLHVETAKALPKYLPAFDNDRSAIIDLSASTKTRTMMWMLLVYGVGER